MQASVDVGVVAGQVCLDAHPAKQVVRDDQVVVIAQRVWICLADRASRRAACRRPVGPIRRRGAAAWLPCELRALPRHGHVRPAAFQLAAGLAESSPIMQAERRDLASCRITSQLGQWWRWRKSSISSRRSPVALIVEDALGSAMAGCNALLTSSIQAAGDRSHDQFSVGWPERRSGSSASSSTSYLCSTPDAHSQP